MFDTNALFTKHEYYLLSHEVAELIRGNSRHLDVTLSWHLPEIVAMERQYQMETRAIELLPGVRKVERLIGIQFNISEEILRQQVRKAIRKHVDDLGLNIVKLDHAKIGWQGLAENAAFRRPPFSPGTGTEKGFRDALVLESFMQLVEASPSSRSVCRVALVSGDKLLRDAAEDRAKGRTNVRILATLEELRNLINTLVSEISEDTVKELREVAGKLFYDFDTHTGFAVTSGAMDRVKSLVNASVAQPPDGAAGVNIGQLGLASPSFQKKEGSIITWRSRFESELQAYVWNVPKTGGALNQPPTVSVANLQTTANAATSGFSEHYSFPNLLFSNPTSFTAMGSENMGNTSGFFTNTLLGGYEKVTTKTGTTAIDVVWTTKVTHKRKLKEPMIIDIAVVETKWA